MLIMHSNIGETKLEYKMNLIKPFIIYIKIKAIK